MKLVWSTHAWGDYQWFLSHDRAVHRKINQLIESIQQSPFTGIGKPEPLKYAPWSGYWSRRITGEHRLVYKVSDGDLFIAQCRFHYQK